ncbi:hypothetical protein [Natronoglomus mannanivorans]|uniref:Uncharacterized protein n=1 Tax=Natronoglomus mannanivorans TaxID=2979990 RepID=A0AAP2Z2Y4_9EURY|nr:hypothetical protein [Halobacteria archaeon AArc-xg1-1]
MPADDIPLPATRDAFRVVVALALLAAPLWAPMLHLSGPTYQYEGTEVVADGDGIAYADESMADASRIPISDEIACSDLYDVRLCAFERLVADGVTVPTDWYRGSPDSTRGPSPDERYRYVMIDETVYETTYPANDSARNENGNYRIDLGLEAVESDDVLRAVSVRASHDDVPDAVAEAARHGSANASTSVTVPETPVRLEDDDGTERYYRVYSSGSSDDTPPMLGLVDWVLRYAAPLVGVALLAGVWSRVEVTYVGGG